MSEGTSGSREQGSYQLLPPTARNDTRASDTVQSGLLIEDKIKNTRESRHLIKHWRWETFTFLLGTAAFTTILALLLQFRDKEIWDWDLSGIQITAIVAALAQVAQSAFLVPISYCIGQLKWEWFQRSKCTIDIDRFDLASRGPDGSIKLLYYLAWKPRLVSLGAIATVLMLVFPTFVQQAVQIKEKQIEAQNSDHAKIKRSINIFEDPSEKAKPPVIENSDMTSPDEVDLHLSKALKNGFTSTTCIENSSPDCAVSAECGGHLGSSCSWPSFDTLALCSSTEDISEEIGQDGIHITLAALQDYLPKGEDPPSFLSRSYLYMKEGQIPPPSLLKTSAKEDTNLPDLAEIYYLYYDVCVDRPSEFNKADRKYWKAFKGRFQFCLQTLSSERPDASTSPQIMYDKADLDWYKTTKFNETAFCTKVESEKEDFCVSESVMESLSTQLNSFFNATAFFNDSNRETIRYSSEYGPILTHDIFGGTRDTMPFCGTMFSSRPANGWSNPDPYGHYGLPGFSDRLRSVADSLNFAFRNDHLGQDVLGLWTYKETFILVDFRWLILPVTLYIIITVFFVATILTTRDVPIWKSSPLPLLYMMSSEDKYGSERMIRKEAKERSMQLRRKKTGWQMIDTTELPRSRSGPDAL